MKPELNLESLLALSASQRPSTFRDDLAKALLESDTPTLVATEIFTGPDGFRYMGLAPIKTGDKGDSFMEWTKVALREGAGIALFKDQFFKGQPSWVYSYGSLWPLTAYGVLDVDPSDEPEFEIEPEDTDEDHEVIIGLPGEAFFPTPARDALSNSLRMNGIRDIGIAIVVDEKLRPSRHLAFSCAHADFPTEEALEKFVQIAQWHLPLTRAFILKPDDADWTFEPLSKAQLN